MACKRKVVNVLMVLKLIDSDDSDDENTRGKTRDWIKRRDNKGYFNNIVKELKMEDTRGFVKMTRMNFEHFNEVLKAIEMDITSHQVIGGHKVIHPAERLTLALR